MLACLFFENEYTIVPSYLDFLANVLGREG